MLVLFPEVAFGCYPDLFEVEAEDVLAVKLIEDVLMMLILIEDVPILLITIKVC